MQQAAAPFRARNADWRVLAAALVLAAIAAGLIVAFLASRDSGTTTAPPAEPVTADPVPVVVVLQDVPAGTVITADMVELRFYPEDTLPAGAIASLSDVVGETTRYPLVSGEQLSIARLVVPGAGNSISFQIPEGLRGFTIPVDVNSSPAALLVPGDFVDVIVLADIQLFGMVPPIGVSENRDYKGAVTIFQNLQVVSVQRDVAPGGVPYDPSVRGELPEQSSISWVTLAVEPEDAQLLFLAASQGSLTLSLRPFGDDTVVEMPPIAEPIALPFPIQAAVVE
jgi:pilus assembly protein CpaB